MLLGEYLRKGVFGAAHPGGVVHADRFERATQVLGGLPEGDFDGLGRFRLGGGSGHGRAKAKAKDTEGGAAVVESQRTSLVDFHGYIRKSSSVKNTLFISQPQPIP